MPLSQVHEVTAGTTPLSGSFSLGFEGHTFQNSVESTLIPTSASAGDFYSALTSLVTLGEIRVSRSGPSAEGELAWTVTFLSGSGDVPTLKLGASSLLGTGAAVSVSTAANGVAPVGGMLSLVVSGVPGEVS